MWCQSRDDIGNKLVFDLYDLIFQRQLLLFQPPQCQLVRTASVFKRMNGGIKISVFAPQHLQANPEHFFKIEFAGRVHDLAQLPSRSGSLVRI